MNNVSVVLEILERVDEMASPSSAHPHTSVHPPHSPYSLSLSLSQVLDARDANTPKEMFDAICHHIKYANNGGNLRYPQIVIFTSMSVTLAALVLLANNFLLWLHVYTHLSWA